ncbi:MAG TPA: hypothetical protein VFE46_12635 [Pirellulales bacterium]|jgi:hypothetical protein|nr:hypothetical protein [Pirellulales bacterium]
MDDDELVTLISANVTSEPDGAYDGIGKWIAVVILAVCVFAAVASFFAR